MEKISRPYGLWESPVSPLMLSQQVRLENPQFDSDGKTLLWLEGRSDRTVLVSRPLGEARLDLTDEQGLRGGVGYGGGEYTAAGGRVVFAAKDGRLYTRRLGPERPRPITPPFGAAASPQLSPDGAWVVYVFSDGQEDALGLVDSAGQHWPVKLASGADFYMQPAWHPSGQRLAWVEWDHPNMPWDGARLELARVDAQHGTPHLVDTRLIAGGKEIPVSQPQFSPDGTWLSYIIASGEFEDLVLIDLESGAERVLVNGDSFHLCDPAWAQGLRWYGWSADSTRIYYLQIYAGLYSLWAADLASGASRRISTAPYTWLSGLSVSPLNDQLALVASAPDISNRVVVWDGHSWRIEARSTGEVIEPAYLPAPRSLTWRAPNGAAVHGLYTPPANPNFSSPGLPPALLKIHGGPTSQVSVKYDSETAYYTSRGWGVLSVNYRGSTSYGRSYRQALLQNWGKVDVEDAVGGAKALAELGLADPGRLVIMGGSAGGYTVLNALVHHPGVFKAGVNLYGVSNLFDLDTHKFELHYNESLVGPLPEASARYHEWSPALHASAIRDPLAVFQGADDKVVPPAHSEAIVAELRHSGVPHIYRLYPGEGHGFRKSETIVDYLEQCGQFLMQHVLFSA